MCKRIRFVVRLYSYSIRGTDHRRSITTLVSRRACVRSQFWYFFFYRLYEKVEVWYSLIELALCGKVFPLSFFFFFQSWTHCDAVVSIWEVINQPDRFTLLPSPVVFCHSLCHWQIYFIPEGTSYSLIFRNWSWYWACGDVFINIITNTHSSTHIYRPSTQSQTPILPITAPHPPSLPPTAHTHLPPTPTWTGTIHQRGEGSTQDRIHHCCPGYNGPLKHPEEN